jgi:hypothetical protein
MGETAEEIVITDECPVTHAPIDMSSEAIDRRLRELNDLYEFWKALRTIRPVTPNPPPTPTTMTTPHLAPGQ